MNQDPYSDPATGVLFNKLGFRDTAELERFERDASLLRSVEGMPPVSITPDGYRAIHKHLFQDVYDWAGKDRTIDIAKGKSYFCRSMFIAPELDKLFTGIDARSRLQGTSPAEFTEHAGVFLGELNVIHPFREGNGRTQRAFLKTLAMQAGHDIDMTLIRPADWHTASLTSFHEMDYDPMRDVIAAAIIPGKPAMQPSRTIVSAKRMQPRR